MRPRAGRSGLLLALGLVLLASAAGPGLAAPPTGLIVNARIWTGDPGQPAAEALAWDARGRILAIGTSEALQKNWPDTPTLSLDGRRVLPGLIDAHGHVMGLGFSLLQADLVGAASIEQVITRLRAQAASLPDGTWLLGRGWDQTRWPGAAFPTAADLDEAFPDRPVLLERVDGHASWANSAAMAQVERDLSGDWQPEGGFIHRDENGQPTGVFIDKAAEVFADAVPEPGEAERELALDRALEHLVSLGVTGVHDAGTSLADLRRFLHRDAAGRLPLRIHALADGDRAALAALCRLGPVQSDRVTMRGVKFYADGALGSRGAALLTDYSDDPGNRGLLFETDAALQAQIDKAMACDLQLAVHAIGDRANRQVIDALIRGMNKHPDNPGRHRIEHVQIIHRDDIARLAEAGVTASMQPTHATSDMRWAEDRLGAQRLFGAYAWQRLRQAGARLAFGSDFPVESANPMLGLYAAITRQDLDGEPPGGWLPDQRVTLEVAIAGFTADAAHAGFAEAEVGTLEVGKRADFIVLDRDPFEIDPIEIPAIKVLSTWLDGKAVYRANTQ
ncbi:MAG: amidohydrolase [Wenzhouxiangellaceae bacterium]|nr:amidohydrolase [Wenzhouxiangellaceae bacterium]